MLRGGGSWFYLFIYLFAFVCVGGGGGGWVIWLLFIAVSLRSRRLLSF
jgi:hypothetical protein